MTLGHDSLIHYITSSLNSIEVCSVFCIKAKCIFTPDLWSTVHRCHLWIRDFLLCLCAWISLPVNIPPKGHKCQIKDLPLEIWKWPARAPGTASLHIFSAREHIFLHFFKTLKQLSPSAERRGKKDFFSKNPRVSVAALLESSWISLHWQTIMVKRFGTINEIILTMVFKLFA